MLFLGRVKSPKSAAFPAVDILKYSIALVLVGFAPPAFIPRVEFEVPHAFVASLVCKSPK